jgi:Family of unknown function (DUF6519)/FG-GAP-like repeat
MGSDKARVTYDPLQQYRSVVMQQGRVTLEADWNEASKITSEEIRKEALDIVGPCGTPDDGYAVLTSGFPGTLPFDFHIQSGTMYVGGMRVHLDDSVQYSNQPDWRDTGPEDPDWVDPAQFVASPSLAPVREFIYLYLREQEVSAVEDPDLKDVALGGPDTAQRTRLLQHFVRVNSQGIDCASGLVAAEGKWETEGLYFDAPSMRLFSWGLLQVGFSNQTQTPNPCQPQAQGGYLDPDNQLIRVQISDPQTPKFLWGFDNASFLYRINIDPNNPQNLVFQQVPVDADHQPLAGQAVEVLRTAADLENGGDIAATSGFVFTLEENYNPDSQSITLPNTISLPADYTSSNQSPPNQLFLRVWQQEVAFTPGQQAQLGNTGIVVTLETQNNQPFHLGDYWVFAVRSSTPQTVYPERYQQGPQRPDGPRLWACPLGVIVWREEKGAAGQEIAPAGNVIADCRPKFGPLATRALHVTNINWPNDDVVSLAEFQRKGLQVAFDWAPDPNSVSSSSFIISLEVPSLTSVSRAIKTAAQVQGFSAALAKTRPVATVRPGAQVSTSVLSQMQMVEILARDLQLPELLRQRLAAMQRKLEAAATFLQFKLEEIGFVSLILKGPLTPGSNLASWTVQPPGYEFIRYLSESSQYGSSPQLRVRVTLKGRDIWSRSEQDMLHLDGQVLGKPGVSAWGNTPRTDLSLPSGLKAEASDFESWFWLTLLAWNRADYAGNGFVTCMAAGDFNGDGKPDLAVVTLPGTVLILLNNGDGTFQLGSSYPAGSFPFSIVAADFTGNGTLDLAISDFFGGTVAILLGNGDGTFSATKADGTLRTQAVGSEPYGIAAADFNGDGKADLAVANASDNTVSILLSNGDGTFARANPDPPVGTTPITLATGDFNGDGKTDLAVVNIGDNTVSFLFNNGTGTFTAPATTLALPQGATNFPLSIVASDFNKDNLVDIAVGGITEDAQNNPRAYVAVFSNNYNNQGAGIFSPPADITVVGAPASVVAADFDGDGNIDLVASGSWSLGFLLLPQPNVNMFSVLMGNGDGTFQPPVIYPSGAGPVALIAADFNGDTLVDLAVGNLNDGTVSILLNEQSQLRPL